MRYITISWLMLCVTNNKIRFAFTKNTLSFDGFMKVMHNETISAEKKNAWKVIIKMCRFIVYTETLKAWDFLMILLRFFSAQPKKLAEVRHATAIKQ
jgi:hypothetical protein